MVHAPSPLAPWRLTPTALTLLGIVTLGCGHIGIDLLDATGGAPGGAVNVGTGSQTAGTNMDLGGATGVSGGQPGEGAAASTGGTDSGGQTASGGDASGGLTSADGGQASGTGAAGGASGTGGWNGRNGSGGRDGRGGWNSCRYGRANTIGSCDSATCNPGDVAGPSGGCYFFITTQTVQSQARSDCQGHGAGWDLTTVRSQAENGFITSQLTVESWIGGSDADVPDTWIWLTDGAVFWQGAVTGTAVDGAPTFWAPGEPAGGVLDATCLSYSQSGDQWLWYETACGQLAGAVCEGPPL